MDNPAGRALESSGLMDLMSILAGFRSPRDACFKGKVYPYAFSAFSHLGLIIAHYHIICCFLTPVFMPDMSFKDAMFFAVPAVTSTVSCLRIYYIMWNRPRFVDLLKLNEEASIDCVYKDQLEEEIRKWANRARVLQPILYFTVAAPIVPWGISPVVNEMLGNPWGPRKVPAISWYPYDAQKTHFWILTLIIQTTAGCHATVSNVMFDAVFICIALRQLALLNHLKNSFSKIFQVIHVDLRGNYRYPNYNGEVVEREEIDTDFTDRLKYWIRRHQATLGLLNRLQSLYSFPLFIHFSYVGVVLATGAAVVLKGTLTSMEYYFVGMHLLGISFNLFVICRIGDYMKTQTDGIADGLYGQNYFMLSKQQHSLIKILLTAIERPFVLTVVQVFPLSTETFQSVMKTTYSFFTMFTHMQRKN